MTDPLQPSGAAAPPASTEEPQAQSGDASTGAPPDMAQELERIRKENQALQSAKDREVARERKQWERKMRQQQAEIQQQITARDAEWQQWVSKEYGAEFQAQAQATQRQSEIDPEDIREARLFKAGKRIAEEAGVPFTAFDFEMADSEADLWKQATQALKAGSGAPEPPVQRGPADRAGSVAPKSAPKPKGEVTEADFYEAWDKGDAEKAQEIYKQLIGESMPILEEQLRKQAMGARYRPS